MQVSSQREAEVYRTKERHQSNFATANVVRARVKMEDSDPGVLKAIEERNRHREAAQLDRLARCKEIEATEKDKKKMAV